jgi:hypothetical protein
MEAGKGLAYVFFSFFKDPGPPPQKIEGEFPLFQDREEAYHKVEGHIANRGFSGKETGSPDQTPGNGDDQGGVLDKGTVFGVSPGPEEIPKGEENDVFTLP